MLQSRKRLVLIGLICTTGCAGSGQIASQVDPHLHTAAVAASVQQAENSAKNMEAHGDGALAVPPNETGSPNEDGSENRGVVRQVEYSDAASGLVASQTPPASSTAISAAPFELP